MILMNCTCDHCWYFTQGVRDTQIYIMLSKRRLEDCKVYDAPERHSKHSWKKAPDQ